MNTILSLNLYPLCHLTLIRKAPQCGRRISSPSCFGQWNVCSSKLIAVSVISRERIHWNFKCIVWIFHLYCPWFEYGAGDRQTWGSLFSSTFPRCKSTSKHTTTALTKRFSSSPCTVILSLKLHCVQLTIWCYRWAYLCVSGPKTSSIKIPNEPTKVISY